MPNKTRSYREALLEALVDPVEAEHYLNAALDDSPEMFLKALKNVAQANQVAKVARKAGVARETLYRSLSDEGNPTLDTLRSVLGVLGFRIAVTSEAAARITSTPVPRTSTKGLVYKVDQVVNSTTPGQLTIEPQNSITGGCFGSVFGYAGIYVGSMPLVGYANVTKSGVVSIPNSTSEETPFLDYLRTALPIEEGIIYGLGQESIGRNAPVAYRI
jgi:probable addiction module antidote protein